jgi:hypothetical protein
MALKFISFFALVTLCLSHTWLDCTKDTGTGLNTGEGDCKGFARAYPGRRQGLILIEL